MIYNCKTHKPEGGAQAHFCTADSRCPSDFNLPVKPASNTDPGWGGLAVCQRHASPALWRRLVDAAL